MSNWSYQNNVKWPSMYKQCSIKNNPNQSPIDILPADIIQECGAKCEIVLKYKSSKCYVTNDHNTITINYDPGSYLIYQNEWYQLTKAKIHTPSLHTINGEHYGAEIDLYHCVDNQCDGGVVLAILLNRGPDHGESVDFINQFINQVPLGDVPVEREIDVAENWNIISLIPTDRTCFVYNGSLPHPPCTPGWKWIVFNQPSIIGTTALKNLQYNIINLSGENIRPSLKLSSYADVYKIPHDSVKVFEERPVRTEPPKVDMNDEDNSKLLNNPNDPQNLTLLAGERSWFTQFFMDYKFMIRRFLMIGLFIMTFILAVKITKYIIKNDLVNKLITRSVDDTVYVLNTIIQQQDKTQPQSQPQPGPTPVMPPPGSQSIKPLTGTGQAAPPTVPK